VTDALNLAAAVTFCREGLQPVYNSAERDKLHCDNAPFVLTVALQAGAVLLGLVLAGLGFRYIAKHMGRKNKSDAGSEPLLAAQ
jgi:hypothetical protein